MHERVTHLTLLERRQGLQGLGLWLCSGPGSARVGPGASYLASGVFGDGNLRDALETAELQDVSLSRWAQGTAHLT